MFLMMAIVWLPLLVVLFWVLRQFGQPPQGSEREPGQRLAGPDADEPDAEEIARRAYARGEIDREHYLQTLEDLRATRGGRGASP